LGIFIRVFLGIATMFSFYLMAKNAYLANSSSAVCSSLIASGMFMTAVFFYFLFGEKIHLQQIGGMLLLLAAVIVISAKPNNTRHIKNPVSIFWPIWFAF
jgi:drug/metabolite transporter (DMT)-like permease